MYLLKGTTSWLIRRDLFRDFNSLNLLKFKLSTEGFKQEIIPIAFFEYGEYISIPLIPYNELVKFLKDNILVKELDIFKIKGNDFKLKWKPLEHQVGIIDSSYSAFKNGETRICISLEPGFGKTFIALSLAQMLGTKMLFITKSSTLKDQAYEAFKNASDLKGVLVVNTSKGFFDIVKNNLDEINCIILTHDMIASIIKTYGQKYFIESIEKIGIGIKIFDEFDLEVSSMYKLETILNIRYNLYLTGTKFKSLRPDDRVFKLIFHNAKDLGSDIKLLPNKDIDILMFKSIPAPLETNRVMFRNRFNIHAYNKVLNQKDHIYDKLKEIYWDSGFLETLKKDNGQTIFFVGRIDRCEAIREKLIIEWGIKPDDIGIVNTSIKQSEKIKAMEKPYIISIMESMGRGIDMKNLRCIILMEFHFSLSSFLQTINRVGRVGKKFGKVIYPVDTSFYMIENTYKKRKGLIAEKFSHVNIKNLLLTPEESEKYKYGYKSDNPALKEILDRMKKSNSKASRSYRVDNYLRGLLFLKADEENEFNYYILDKDPYIQYIEAGYGDFIK